MSAVIIALLQAAVYPWLYRASNDVLYLTAYSAVQRGAHTEALRALRQLHRRVPSYEISRFLAGWAHHCLKQYEAALKEYRLAEQYVPDYAQTYANAGYILFEQGKYDEAAAYFRAHLARAPDNAGSQAMLAECERKLQQGPQIVFFSPQSNYYFMMGGIDSSLVTAFLRHGIYRCADAALRVQWLQRGRWRQDSNGIIHIDTTFLSQRGTREHQYAGVWRYRGVTFLCKEPSLASLLAKRDEIRTRVDKASSMREPAWVGWTEVNAMKYAVHTGAVNMFLGALVDEGFIPLPFWLVRGVQWVVAALLFILPAAAVTVFVRVRPRMRCPACGAEQTQEAVRGVRTLRCRACKKATRLHVPHFWSAWGVVSGTDTLLTLWWLWLATTIAPMNELAWLALLMSVMFMAYAARVRLYARWLFAHAAAPAAAAPRDVSAAPVE